MPLIRPGYEPFWYHTKQAQLVSCLLAGLLGHTGSNKEEKQWEEAREINCHQQITFLSSGKHLGTKVLLN